MNTQAAPRTHLDVGGLDTAYVDFTPPNPQGDPILALHGWGASIDLVAPLALRLMTKGFRVIAPDLPGFGESPPPPLSWSVYDYAAHLVAFMDALQLKTVRLFGHSFGGRLSIILGAEHPQRITCIALANSAGVPPRKSALVQARTAVYKGARNGLRTLGLRTLSDKLREGYVARYASDDYRSAGVLRDSFVRIVNEDLLPIAAQIAAPTLLFWGARDQDTPLWQGHRLQETIPNAGIVVYEDAGHYSYLDRLGDVVTTLDYFYTHPTRG